MTIPAPSRERVSIRTERTQLIVGIVAIVSLPVGIGFLALSVKPLAIAALLSFFVFGNWWVVLEWLRRGEMRQANRKYEEEVARFQAEISSTARIP
jgi:hypothetical protein